ARLAKATRKPVAVMRARGEELRHADFRPVARSEVRGGVDADGKLVAWECQNWNSSGSGLGTPYEAATEGTEFHPTRPPLRQGSYRALASTANHFAREAHMDELAHLAGIDPLDFRMKNLRDERLMAVLKAAADKFGWSAERRRRKGTGYGLACGLEKGGYV